MEIEDPIMILIVNEWTVEVENDEKGKVRFVVEYHHRWTDEVKGFDQESMKRNFDKSDDIEFLIIIEDRDESDEIEHKVVD